MHTCTNHTYTLTECGVAPFAMLGCVAADLSTGGAADGRLLPMSLLAMYCLAAHSLVLPCLLASLALLCQRRLRAHTAASCSSKLKRLVAWSLPRLLRRRSVSRFATALLPILRTLRTLDFSFCTHRPSCLPACHLSVLCCVVLCCAVLSAAEPYPREG